jgi:hypothetical protein
MFIRFFGIINRNEKIEKRKRTVLGPTVAHGFGLPAWPSRGFGPRCGVRRAPDEVTTYGARVEVRSPSVRWCLAGDEVLLASTGESPGRRRARSHGLGLTRVLGRR